MSISQSSISAVSVAQDGPEIFISWTSTAPWGTIFQVYLNRRLTWSGPSRFCYSAAPASLPGATAWVEVGTVDLSEVTKDFSGNLSGLLGAGNRAALSWYGGTYLDPTGHDDVQGFRVYMSPAPGAAVDLSSPAATIAAYPGGVIIDGFGMGQFGSGGFGRAASYYAWSSRALTSGTWTFQVIPYDRAGNAQTQGTAATTTISIQSAPRAPAVDSNGARLSYQYSGPSTRQVTLHWVSSPS